jgi:hypothetical protein
MGSVAPQPPGRTPHRSALRPGGDGPPPEASAVLASAPAARRTAREAMLQGAVRWADAGAYAVGQ